MRQDDNKIYFNLGFALNGRIKNKANILSPLSEKCSELLIYGTDMIILKIVVKTEV